MEQHNKKWDPSPIILGFILILLVIVFVISVAHGLADSLQGVLLLGALGVLIVTGFLRFLKTVRAGKSASVPPTTGTVPAVSRPVSAAAPQTPPTESGGISFAPATPVAPASVSSPVSGGKLGAWFQAAPKKTRVLVLAGLGVVFISLILVVSGVFAGPPTGTWTQEGYEDRVRYEFYEDKTWEMYDYGVLSQSGYYVQTGNHVDLHILYYYGSDQADGYETAYYVIHGDLMTSGGVRLDRTGD